MKYQKELSERLSAAMGRDVSDVVAELFALGVLDEGLARRGCVMQVLLMSLFGEFLLVGGGLDVGSSLEWLELCLF